MTEAPVTTGTNLEPKTVNPTTYRAVVGLDFDGLKPPVRVESGGALPKKVSAADIKWLLEQRLIRVVQDKAESEDSV